MDELPEVVDGSRVLLRQLVWDLNPDDEVPAMAKALGLIPPSSEVESREQVMSHIRVQRVLPLNVPVNFLAENIAKVTTEATLTGQQPTAQQRSTTLEKHTLMVRNSIVAALAALIDMGAITYGPGVSQ
jgi:hypothetical protein